MHAKQPFNARLASGSDQETGTRKIMDYGALWWPQCVTAQTKSPINTASTVLYMKRYICCKTKNKLTLKTKHSPVPKKLNLLPPLFRSSQSVDRKAPQT